MRDRMDVKMSLKEFKELVADRGMPIWECDGAVYCVIADTGVLAPKKTKTKVFRNSIKVEKIGKMGVNIGY